MGEVVAAEDLDDPGDGPGLFDGHDLCAFVGKGVVEADREVDV